MEKISAQDSRKEITYNHINELVAAQAKANNAGGELKHIYETTHSFQFDNGEELHIYSKPAYYFQDK